MDNKKNSSDLTGRYLYAVTKRLPKEQRGDIEKELSSLIEDMLAEKAAGNEPSQKDIEAVLLELGKPAELAAKYRGAKNYLIGPDLFSLYLTVLKIVVAATAGGLTIALFTSYIFTPGDNPFTDFANYFSTVFNAVLQAFAWVTIGFAFAQKYNAKIDDADKKWDPNSLPEVPAEKAKIKKSEPVAGIIFTALCMLLFNAAPNLIGLYNFSEKMTFIPLFESNVFISMLPLINTVLALNIGKEIIRLVIEKYNLKLAAAVTLINIISFTLFAYIFISQDIWNADFITSLKSLDNFSITPGIDLADIWSRVPKYFVGIALFGYAVDTITTIVKSVRYSIQQA